MNLPQSLDKILRDPSAYYAKPQNVADDESLTREQKDEILRCWEEDENAKIRAASESMTSPEQNHPSGEALSSIRKLRAEIR